MAVPVAKHVVALVALSSHDMSGSDRSDVRHLERVDTLKPLRRHGLLREMLRRYLLERPSVQRLTLSVHPDNVDAQAAYRQLKFTPSADGDDYWVLEGSELAALRAAQPLPPCELLVEFERLDDGRATIASFTAAAYAEEPSRQGAACMQLISTCAAGCRELAGTTGDDERQAVPLLTGGRAGRHATFDYSYVSLPRVQLERLRAQHHLASACVQPSALTGDVEKAVAAWKAAKDAEASESATAQAAHPLDVRMPAKPLDLSRSPHAPLPPTPPTPHSPLPTPRRLASHHLPSTSNASAS